MKKLLFALALLIITSQGAWAVCNTDTDKFDVDGWCISSNSQLTPKALTSNGVATGLYGGYQVPVSTDTVANTNVTLTAAQSGYVVTDSGGVTSDTLTGFGSKFILPRATVGLEYTLAVGSKSFSTLDTLDTADTFMYSIAGVGFQMGDSMKSTGQAGDSVSVTCTKAGQWTIAAMHSAWTNNGTL